MTDIFKHDIINARVRMTSWLKRHYHQSKLRGDVLQATLASFLLSKCFQRYKWGTHKTLLPSPQAHEGKFEPAEKKPSAYTKHAR